MFQKQVPLEQTKNMQSCLCFGQKHQTITRISSEIDDSEEESASLRKKMHKVLAENFELKEVMDQMRGEIQNLRDQKIKMRDQIRSLLEEISISDKKIDVFKHNLSEYHAQDSQIQTKIRNYQEIIQKCQANVQELSEHNRNLEIENHMIREIKNKYANDIIKLKIELDYEHKSVQKNEKQSEALSNQIKVLLEDISMLETQLESRRREINNYESYVIERINEIKCSKEFHEKCWKDAERLKEKCGKYKKKSSIYKRERDELAYEIQKANLEIGSHSLRKYFYDVQD